MLIYARINLKNILASAGKSGVGPSWKLEAKLFAQLSRQSYFVRLAILHMSARQVKIVRVNIAAQY